MAGFFIGRNTNKATFLEVINAATGGGFTLTGNKLHMGADFKPAVKFSAAFRKKFISTMNNMSVNVTFHFSTSYYDNSKSGTSTLKLLPNSFNAQSGYASRAGTDMTVIMWGSEGIEKTIPNNKHLELVMIRAAILIHELNVHIFSSISNDKRSSYEIMKETKKMLIEGVGMPPLFKAKWSDNYGLTHHDSNMLKEKGNNWYTPNN